MFCCQSLYPNKICRFTTSDRSSIIFYVNFYTLLISCLIRSNDNIITFEINHKVIIVV